MALKYKSGDRVFAKVRGYPYWPARIEACADETPNKMKYHVYFYGTAETAICKAEEVVPYHGNKDKYGKPLKRKGFNEGLQQIEMELNGFAPVYPTYTDSVADSEEAENEGSLIIDENLSSSNPPSAVPTPVEKKKKLTTVLKRKRESMDSVSEDFSAKIKQARLSVGTPVGTVASVDGDSPPSKVKAVSRSGRKIKPKKFADEDDDEEDGGYDPYENGTIPAEIPTAPVISPVALGSSPDPSASKPRKGQAPAVAKSSIAPTQHSPDESAKTPSDTQSGIPSDNPNRAIMAKSLSGHWVQIRLDDERPAFFESEKARQMWDAATARNAERLRTQIELGEYLPDTIRKQLEGKAELTEAQKKELRKESELARKRGKLRWLKQEAHLLELDAQIRSSLSLVKADTRRCLQLMDEVLAVNIDPLMLKKHPNIVETVKKLQRYIGNVSKWGLSKEETDKFNSGCEQIRVKANHMYHKLKKLFAVPTNKSFWEVFNQEVVRFNDAVKHMSRDKVYALVVDPEKLTNFEDSDEEGDNSQSKKKSSKSPRGRKASSTLTESTSVKTEELTDAAS